MHAALRALNQIVADGVIENYAVGGAIAASFYIEASATQHLDIFVLLPTSRSGLLSLTPIHDALVAQGGAIDREYIRFENWPVQVLSAYKPLVEEALAGAVDVAFDGIPTRVVSAEHVCAIALDTARPKDYLRVAMFIEQDAVDIDGLHEMLVRYDLQDREAKIPNWPREQSR